MTATQVPLPGLASASVGLVALGMVALDAGWRIIRHFTVMAHEGAHAATGTLLLGDFNGIVLNPDATGATGITPRGGLTDVFTTFAGYAGPSIFGLGAAKLIELRYIVSVLWVTLFLLAVLLLCLRASFGRRTVVLAVGLVFLVGRYVPAPVQTVAAYAIAWLLLLSGVRRVIEVGMRSSDGEHLRKLTHLPQFLWFLIWLASTLAAVAAGGKMLVMPNQLSLTGQSIHLVIRDFHSAWP
ncbi:MAG TPA: M50 family metallopeptidase [Streptosporangiaceae bacterium]